MLVPDPALASARAAPTDATASHDPSQVPPAAGVDANFLTLMLGLMSSLNHPTGSQSPGGPGKSQRVASPSHWNYVPQPGPVIPCKATDIILTGDSRFGGNSPEVVNDFPTKAESEFSEVVANNTSPPESVLAKNVGGGQLGKTALLETPALMSGDKKDRLAIPDKTNGQATTLFAGTNSGGTVLPGRAANVSTALEQTGGKVPFLQTIADPTNTAASISPQISLPEGHSATISGSTNSPKHEPALTEQRKLEVQNLDMIPATRSLNPSPAENTSPAVEANPIISLADQIKETLAVHTNELQPGEHIALQMTLDQPGFGHVQIQVNLDKGQLDVHFLVQNDQAKHFLNQQMPALRSRLAEMGFSPGQFDARRQGKSSEWQSPTTAGFSAQALQPGPSRGSGRQKRYATLGNARTSVDLIV